MCPIVKNIIQNIDTENFATVHCCLISPLREIVGIVASVQHWSNDGTAAHTFLPNANVEPKYPYYLGNTFQCCCEKNAKI